ncbi:AraC family transcriptional regulator ligand-binding domain-containing protein [Caulobacter sp. NIBR1757]|uniref:AraC family transcriptional regulator ligand-binding domain-containing protein n=1 Tax=Caulobacter sp. NIBR1757 TaxID=3016000 RepID=UPI0022EFDAD2|nr:AraC family transcriptional regulator ligand-binding domain-containing protein [Caulobacter sp. NIBR1757]
MDGRALNEGGLDGEAVQRLLQGAVLKGRDPLAILRDAGIEASVYGNAQASIDGPALVRLARQIQIALDDVYFGFLGQGCRLALETERLLSFLHCGTFGEALRVSIRFTDAMSADVGPWIAEEHGAGLQHICKYQTIPGVDRDILVWIRFVWIYHLFSWLIGRPLALRGILVRGPRPVQANGFDRFALFRCPITYNAPVDALCYSWSDLAVRLVHSSITEYNDYYASAPDWFASPDSALSWREQAQQVLIELQRAGMWSAPIEVVAARLRTRPRRLRQGLASEGESFQDIRTRLRGELAGAYLLASDMPISTIGDTLGFSEPGGFSRQFLAWAGMTPSAYRALHLADPAKIAAATALLNERRGA